MSPRRAGVGHRGRSSAVPFTLTEQFFLSQHRPDATGPRFQVHWDPDAGTVAAGPLVFNAALLAERWRRHGVPLMMDWENDRARDREARAQRLRDGLAPPAPSDEHGPRPWLCDAFGVPEDWPSTAQRGGKLEPCQRCGQRSVWRADDGSARCPRCWDAEAL